MKKQRQMLLRGIDLSVFAVSLSITIIITITITPIILKGQLKLVFRCDLADKNIFFKPISIQDFFSNIYTKTGVSITRNLILYYVRIYLHCENIVLTYLLLAESG